MSKSSGSKPNHTSSPPSPADSSRQQQQSLPGDISNNPRRSSSRYPHSYTPPPQNRTVSSHEDSRTAPRVHGEPVPFAHLPYGLAPARPRILNSGLYRSTSSQVAGSEASTLLHSNRSRPSLNLSLTHSSERHTSSSSVSAHSVPYQDSPYSQTPSVDLSAPILSLDPNASSNTVYERELLQKKHGFPLWIPHPNARLPKSYTDKGVSVGDVGIITPYGAFDYLFNVCLHAEHANNVGQLPEGFVPLLIQQKDICEFPEHGEGSSMCSSSITSSQSPSGLSFESVEAEGAILTMPEGAVHEDVRNLSKFREYAALHAPSWYRFANGVCGREIENGELHLVTGCDKTTSWGMASFSRGVAPMALEFAFDTDEEGKCVCSWGHRGNAEVKANSVLADGEGNRARNQCTFVRSYTVMLSDDEWAKVQVSVEAAGGGYASDATTDTATSRRSSKNALKRLFSSFSQKSYSSSQRSQPAVVTKSFTDTPRRCPHPSSVINKLLLKKVDKHLRLALGILLSLAGNQQYPRARVAITHDEEWAVLIQDPSNPPSASSLWDDIQLKFDIILDASGGVYLSLKEAYTTVLDQKPLLTDIDIPDGALSSTSRTEPRSSEDEVDDPTKFTMESLIDSLVMSEAPSPAEARLLIKMLSTQAPPPFPTLQRVFFPLFSADKSPLVHALGFDVLTAYWENPFVKDSAEPRMTSDRLSCFTFFLEPTLVSWSLDSWENQFKAFKAVTKGGTRIKGIELVAIDLLKRWVLVAFQRLVYLTAASEVDSLAECERCVLAVGGYLVDVMKQTDNVARVHDDVLIGVLQFHSTLIDQLILLPSSQTLSSQHLLMESPVSPLIENSLRRGHKKRGSSLSLSSIMFAPAAALTPTPKPQTPLASGSSSSSTAKHPAESAISLYIDHLSTHMLNLSAQQLVEVLPSLFRALAFCASPLPRLTLQTAVGKAVPTLEDRVVELLNTLVASSSFPTCMKALKVHLSPSSNLSLSESGKKTGAEEGEGMEREEEHVVEKEGDEEKDEGAKREGGEYPFPGITIAGPATSPTAVSASGSAVPPAPDALDNKSLDSLYLMIMTSLGASRTLRNYVRKALAARLESVYHAQDPPSSRGNASSRFAIDQDLMDVVWLRHDHHSGVGSNMEPTKGEVAADSQTLASSIDAWVTWDTDLPALELNSSQHSLYEKIRDGREHILEESAGILKDIYQEFDSREETTSNRDESELDPINDGLKCLSTYLVSLQSPDGTPFIINAFLPGDAPTPLLRSITTLLSRDFSRCHNPLIAEILLLVCEHVTDENTACIPTCLMGYHQLIPICPTWIDNWTTLLKMPALLGIHRPLTREIIIVTLNKVYFSIKDVPSHRQMLADLIIEVLDSIVGPEFCDPLWEVLEDDAVTVIGDLSSESENAGQDQRNTLLPPSVRMLAELAVSQTDSIALPVLRTLINIFSQISFTLVSSVQTVQRVSLSLFQTFVKMLTTVASVPCRLMVLQFLMRLRADRNHRVYLAVNSCDTNGLVSYLASLINRVPDSLMQAHRDEILEEHVARTRQARSRATATQSKNPPSSSSSAARSRSRTLLSEPVLQREYTPLWQLPEKLPFKTEEADCVKNHLISYDPQGPNRVIVLPISQYLQALATLIETEPSWELVSYVLCYLPVQLSNKHLFCGPNTRASITELLYVLSSGIIRGHLASQTAENCPENLKFRDLQGLAHHTLSTMISYKNDFDLQQRILLLEAFKTGLDGPFSTIKCCLHALTLSAYETPIALSKALPELLQKLSQIMSNPNMAVHILAFLNIVGTLPALYASFTDDDFKMVFGVALQYLQHYNQLRESPTRSWALSQHVRQQSYCAVYTWFLVLKLPDRQRHIPYITRQLLLANEGKEDVDGLTQVCFDWLARNTYGMADTKTVVHDIVLQPNIAKPQNTPFKKTWMLGNMFISVRPTQRPGWVELMSRRPSGSASLVCRRDDFLRFARNDETEELSSFLGVLEKSSGELGEPSSPSCDLFYQEAVLHPPVHHEGDKQTELDQLTFASQLFFHLTPLSEHATIPPEIKDVTDVPTLGKSIGLLDKIPVIDTHKVGIMYAAPGQTSELDILRNAHGSQAYTRFLDSIGRLIKIRTEKDVYTGSLDPNEDGEYAYAWWDNIRQILFHTATLMPTHSNDPNLNYKKRHIGNDYVRIVWNDSGLPYKFDTLATAFQFVNIVIEPHSLGTISAFSNDAHENEFFRVSVQTAVGMTECTPVGQFKIVSALNLAHYVRQLSVLTDCFTSIFSSTGHDTRRVEIITNWNARLDSMGRFKKQANEFYQTAMAQGAGDAG